MGAIASQITSLTIVYSTVYSDVDQRKHQSFASLAFVWGIHRGSVNSPHKWPVTREMFPFDDVIMCGIALWWMSLIWNQYCSGNGLVQLGMGSRKPIFNQCSVKIFTIAKRYLRQYSLRAWWYLVFLLQQIKQLPGTEAIAHEPGYIHRSRLWNGVPSYYVQVVTFIWEAADSPIPCKYKFTYKQCFLKCYTHER